MVRHFEGLTIVDAGTLRRDSEGAGFLLMDFASQNVHFFRFDTAPNFVPWRTEAMLP